MFATYAHDIVGEAPCTVAADAIDEVRIRNKIRAVEAKAIEYSFSFFFIYFPRVNFINNFGSYIPLMDNS
jgi:hypothetical protein